MGIPCSGIDPVVVSAVPLLLVSVRLYVARRVSHRIWGIAVRLFSGWIDLNARVPDACSVER